MKRELTVVWFAKEAGGADAASLAGSTSRAAGTENSRRGLTDEPRVGEKSRLGRVLAYALAGREYRLVSKVTDCDDLSGQHILFALELDEAGFCLEALQLIRLLRLTPGFLRGCRGAMLVDGPTELYTKGMARQLALAANEAGCAFPGRSLVEATGSLYNFKVIARNLGTTDLEQAYRESARDLVTRLVEFQIPTKENPVVLAVHASKYDTSNTYSLWNMVKGYIQGCQVQEVSLRSTVQDCVGCPYTACLHFSEERSCFFGGTIVDDVYPAILAADALVLLCPNYNDALGANLTAMINRLTALVRTHGFYDKYLFAIVVSGYSGGDIVARQLVGSLSMNKTFALPPRFALLETANERGSIFAIDDIGSKAAEFAARIMESLQND